MALSFSNPRWIEHVVGLRSQGATNSRDRRQRGRRVVPLIAEARRGAGLESDDLVAPGRTARERRVALRIRVRRGHLSRERDQPVGRLPKSGRRFGAAVLRDCRVDDLGCGIDDPRSRATQAPLAASRNARSCCRGAASRDTDSHRI